MCATLSSDMVGLNPNDPPQEHPLRVGSLFSGYGGLDLAVEEVFGARTIWHAEYEPPTPERPNPKQAPARVLAARWPGVPNLGDVSMIDWATVPPVDVLAGGFPCQDVSAAGRRAGMRAGNRSGLWARMCDAIEILRPTFVVAENVRGLLSAEADSDVESCAGCVGDGSGVVLRALGRVLGDLADLGYDAQWHGLRAADVGAPHGRFRIFIVATDTRGEAERLGTGLRASGQGRLGRGRPDDDSVPRITAGRDAPDASRGSVADGLLGGDPAGLDERAILGAGGRDREGRTAARVSDVGGTAAVVAARGLRRDRRADGPQWGPYADAVRRWEQRLGRDAPAPTELAPKGGQRLSCRFVEWMMGLPAGWVTDVPGISRNDQLRMLGNGVVPQQGVAALRHITATWKDTAA